VDEGKQFYVRRIEFQGNTTTRDKVIRREIAPRRRPDLQLALWEFSLLRLNQLGYFDQLKPDDPNTTERHLDEKNGTVDLTLKVTKRGRTASACRAASAVWPALSSASITAPTTFWDWAKRSRCRPASAAASATWFSDSPSLICSTGPSRPASTSTPARPTMTRLGSMPFYRTESEPALRLPAEPAELLAVQHRLRPERELSAAPFASSASASATPSTALRWSPSATLPSCCSRISTSAASPAPTRSPASSPARSLPASP
jgi:hypothetical protein